MSDIVQFSVPRSGSTFVTQVLRDLFPEKQIIKTHSFTDRSDKVVTTIRDFRDCLASNWRVLNNILFEELKNRRPTKLEIDREICRTIDFLNELTKMNRYFGNKMLVLRYEHFFNDYNHLFDQLERHFSINIDSYKRNLLSNRYNLETNRAKTEELENFSKWEESGIHGLHIYKGEVGTFKDIIPLEFHKKIQDSLEPFLHKWLYQ